MDVWLAAAGPPALPRRPGEPVGRPARHAGAGRGTRCGARRTVRRPLGYTEALGVPALRAAIAGHYRAGTTSTSTGRVAVTTGSSGGFLLAFLAAFDVGDRVRSPSPATPRTATSYGLGCEVVSSRAARRPGTSRPSRSSRRSTARSTGLVVASPANPTGTMIDPDELAALAAWCGEHGVRLISDEIYHGITYASHRRPRRAYLAASPSS